LNRVRNLVARGRVVKVELGLVEVGGAVLGVVLDDFAGNSLDCKGRNILRDDGVVA
jgi:hypothetical protein